MTKSSGPRTEPWGTPQEDVYQEHQQSHDVITKRSEISTYKASFLSRKPYGEDGTNIFIHFAASAANNILSRFTRFSFTQLQSWISTLRPGFSWQRSLLKSTTAFVAYSPLARKFSTMMLIRQLYIAVQEYG